MTFFFSFKRRFQCGKVVPLAVKFKFVFQFVHAIQFFQLDDIIIVNDGKIESMCKQYMRKEVSRIKQQLP